MISDLLLQKISGMPIPVDSGQANDLIAELGDVAKGIEASGREIALAYGQMLSLWPEHLIPAPDDVAGAVAWYSQPRTDRKKIEDAIAGAPVRRNRLRSLAIRESDLYRTYPELRPALVTGLLRDGETMNIIAGTKIGKSWLAHYLAFAVANGSRWLGHECARRKVLLIDNELHAETISGRLSAVRSELFDRGMEFHPNSDITVVPLRGEDHDLSRIAGDLEDFVEDGGFGLIIIDALYRTIPEGTSENDNSQMMKLYNTLDRCAKKCGAAIVVIHHASKGDQSNKTVTDIGSGASSINRAADSMIALRAHEIPGFVSMHTVARSWPASMCPPKVIQKIGVVWDVVEGADPEALKGVDQSRLANGQKRLRDDELLSLVTNRPTAAEVFKEKLTGVSIAAIKSRLKYLIDGEQVREVIEGAQKLYCLPGSDHESRRKRAASDPSDEEDVFSRKLSREWILELVEKGDSTLSTIAKTTEAPKSSLHRLLADMVSLGSIAKGVADDGDIVYRMPEVSK